MLYLSHSYPVTATDWSSSPIIVTYLYPTWTESSLDNGVRHTLGCSPHARTILKGPTMLEVPRVLLGPTMQLHQISGHLFLGMISKPSSASAPMLCIGVTNLISEGYFCRYISYETDIKPIISIICPTVESLTSRRQDCRITYQTV
jgi:hypothetical protein